MLNCKDITDLLTEYLEGQMSLADRMQVKMHLAMCGHCQRYVDQLKLTIDSCGGIPEPEVDDHLEQELLARFRNWKTRSGDVPP